jgi:hypothetical protein
MEVGQKRKRRGKGWRRETKSGAQRRSGLPETSQGEWLGKASFECKVLRKVLGMFGSTSKPCSLPTEFRVERFSRRVHAIARDGELIDGEDQKTILISR